MKKFTKVTVLIAILIATMAGTNSTEHYNGIAGKTNSPGEVTCNTSGCHSDSPINPLGGSITITSSNMSNWEYIPGTTYHMTVTIINTTNDWFGFDVEALAVNDTISAGTFIVTNDTTQLKSATISGKVRRNITHTGDDVSGLPLAFNDNSFFSFHFDWQAPATDSGYVKFYVAGVAADGSGDPTGDYVYTTTQIVSSPMTVGIHNPVASNSFSIYPNPVQNNCNIHFASGVKEGKCDIELYNIAGALVQSVRKVPVSGNEISDYKIADDVTSGVYFMKITANGNISTQKVIVNKN